MPHIRALPWSEANPDIRGRYSAIEEGVIERGEIGDGTHRLNDAGMRIFGFIDSRKELALEGVRRREDA